MGDPSKLVHPLRTAKQLELAQGSTFVQQQLNALQGAQHSIQNKLLQLLQHDSGCFGQACHSLVCDACIPCKHTLTLQLLIVETWLSPM